MKLKDSYPLKAQFIKGEKIQIKIELEEIDNYNNEFIILKLYNLQNELTKFKKDIKKDQENLVFEFDIEISTEIMMGYGVELELHLNDTVKSKIFTSFDVVRSWKYAPRYGFLSDFFEKDKNDENDIIEMNKFHLNVVQFYDWMYRHHELLPPVDKFIDILGRELCIDVVKQKIEFAHKYGMTTMAYGAVYGAEKEFFDKHQDWVLRKNDGSIMDFINLIYIMDISRECGWHDHIISEYLKAIKFGFDGIHMDQYGFPKEAAVLMNGKVKIRNLKKDYFNLINDTKSSIESSGHRVDLIFNAVNNWPIESVATSQQDAMYIEVWSPNDTYMDLYNLICNAKRYDNNKQVILAAYMKPYSKNVNVEEELAENSILMTMATIFASGGFHLLLGENKGVLSEPYYPDHKTITSKVFEREVRNYYDFIVRYEELLQSLNIVDNTRTHSGGINGEYVFSGASFSTNPEVNHVWTLVKEKPGFKIINLVNYLGINNMNWNEAKNRPQNAENITITALVAEEVAGVYVASPDYEGGSSKAVSFEYVKHDQGNAIKFTVPILKLWNLIYIVLN